MVSLSADSLFYTLPSGEQVLKTASKFTLKYIVNSMGQRGRGAGGAAGQPCLSLPSSPLQPELPAAGCICPALCALERSSPILPAATLPQSLLKPSKSTGGSLSPPQTVPPAGVGSHQEPQAHADTFRGILPTPTPTSEAIAFAHLVRPWWMLVLP